MWFRPVFFLVETFYLCVFPSDWLGIYSGFDSHSRKIKEYIHSHISQQHVDGPEWKINKCKHQICHSLKMFGCKNTFRQNRTLSFFSSSLMGSWIVRCKWCHHNASVMFWFTGIFGCRYIFVSCSLCNRIFGRCDQKRYHRFGIVLYFCLNEDGRCNADQSMLAFHFRKRNSTPITKWSKTSFCVRARVCVYVWKTSLHCCGISSIL